MYVLLSLVNSGQVEQTGFVDQSKDCKSWKKFANQQSWIQDLLIQNQDQDQDLFIQDQDQDQDLLIQDQDQDCDIQDQNRDSRLTRPILEVHDWDGLWQTKRLKKSWQAENPACR